MRDDDTVEKESMEYELAYEIIDSTGSKIEASEAVAKICDNDIHINGLGHAPLKLSYNDVRKIENKSWLIELTFSDGCIIVLKKLGRLFDSFLNEVMAEYKKTAKKALLMQEKELSLFQNASFSLITENTSISERGSVHVQETGLMFASEKGDMHRIPYAFTEALEQKQWSFLIKLRNGSVYTIGMLGTEYDNFLESLHKAIGNLEVRALDFIRTLSPSASPLKARALSKLFLDGLAVARKDLKNSPEILRGIENKVANSGLANSWSFILPLSDTDSVRIGIKQGLYGGSDSEYIWFFAPIIRANHSTVILEASSEGTGGRATYLFDIPDGVSAERLMDDLNYCLYMINFRREPIYLSSEQLQKPNYSHYLQAVNRVPSLGAIRRLFIKRILHRSKEQWESELYETLDRK